jgi:hypothetical protein
MGTLTSRVARAGPFAVRGPATPTDLVNFGRVRNLPMLLGIALCGLALVTIAHLLITSVRRRRRDFAILRALGFTRGQVRRTAAWQAATLTAAALAIGIPAGAVCGRAAWLIFARHLGIVPVPDIPLPWFAVLIPIALGLAVAIAALPGESAARAKPAHLLRSEWHSIGTAPEPRNRWPTRDRWSGSRQVRPLARPGRITVLVRPLPPESAPGRSPYRRLFARATAVPA